MLAREGTGRRRSPFEALAVACAGLLAAVIAAPSLAYPFGRDQGVYFYVAREWLVRGALPYRDAFDHKTPGVYLVHALSIALFGQHTWAIRALEIPAVAALGLLAASIARPPPAERRWAVRALTVLGVSALYYGHFGFWDTAQPELWGALLTVAGLALVLRTDPGSPHARGAWAVAGAGALLGLAVLMKPSVLPMCAVVAWVAGRRRVLPLIGGAAAPILAVAAYFAAHGAFRTLVDVVVSANLLYAKNENVGGVTDALTRTLDVARQTLPTSLVLAYGAALSFRRARRRKDEAATREYGVAIALGAAAIAGVAMQLKFYTYHFVLLLAPAALAFALLVRDLLEALRARGWTPARATHLVTAHVVGLFALSWVGEHLWFSNARDGLLLATGRLPAERYLARFRIDPVRFDAAANDEVSRWLRGHAQPGDRLCDRSFEPELYAQTGMRCDDRFFWTPWVADPHRAYHRDDWAAQDLVSLVQSPPRFVTVKVDAPEPANRESYFAPLGYAPRAWIGSFVVLERGASDGQARRD